MTDWTWRQHSSIPLRALVVAGRTEYDDEGWKIVQEIMAPSFHRVLGDPNILGLEMRAIADTKTVWSVSAWTDYTALEQCLTLQSEWLTEATQQLESSVRLRHNAYRMLDTSQLPLAWPSVEGMVENVMKASPLGADAFPELSEKLGMQPLPGGITTDEES